MGSTTGIAWTDHTFNPWRGCTKVSAGCANCYAETMSKRNPAALGEWGPNGKRAMAAPSYWRLPARWDKAAQRDGVLRRVFCASLADVFEDRPELVGPRRTLFAAITATPNLDWLLLTKRPQNIARLIPDACLPNVWLGVSVEDQKTADERIPLLLDTPAAVRFVSYEPALGPVDFRRWLGGSDRDIDEERPLGSCVRCGVEWEERHKCPPGFRPFLDWIIVGGESGPKARPFDIAGARSAVEQCRRAGVACFVKQLGANPVPLAPMRLPSYNALTGRRHRGWLEDGPHAISDPAGADPAEWPEDLRVREFPR